MIKKLTAILTGAVLSVTSFSVNASCSADAPMFTTDIGLQTLRTWGTNAYYDSPAGGSGYKDSNTGAAYFTMAHYAPDAVLLPTVSYVSRVGLQGIYDYFIDFLKKNPGMSKANLKGGTTLESCGVGVMSGYYNFDLGTGAERKKAEARYTMQFEYLAKPREVSVTLMDGADSGKILHYTQPVGWYIKMQNSAALPAKHEDFLDKSSK